VALAAEQRRHSDTNLLSLQYISIKNSKVPFLTATLAGVGH